MGQYWKTVNLDKKYYPCLFGKLGEAFWWLAEAKWFVRPVMPSKRLWTMSDRLVEIKQRPTTAPLLRLPAELILLIFEDLDDIIDMLVFCLAHDILGALGEPLVYARVAEIIASWSWAGDRFMCIGDYTDDDDYPPDVQEFVTQAVARYVDAGYADEESYNGTIFYHCCERENESDAPIELRHCLWGWDHRLDILRVRVEPSPEMKRFRALKFFPEEQHGQQAHVDADARRFQAAKRAITEMYDYTSDARAVLCNISKAEYIRGDAIAKLNELPRMKDQTGGSCMYLFLGLDQVFSAYACWSSDPSCSLAGWKNRHIEERVARGRWAGDRFEVTLLDEMRAGMEWKDITNEAVEWLTELIETDGVI